MLAGIDATSEAVIIGLGCEKTNLSAVERYLQKEQLDLGKPVVRFGIQETGGTKKTVEAISGTLLHKQNFRRLVEQGGLVEATGKNPPANPADPDVDMREAVAWAALSGTLIALARMLATRRAAKYYAKSTGHLPPGLRKDDQDADAPTPVTWPTGTTPRAKDSSSCCRTASRTRCSPARSA